MYSFKQVLKQEPAAIKDVLALAFTAVIGLKWISLTDLQVGLIITFVGALLTLFYIRPLTSSKDALQELQDGS